MTLRPVAKVHRGRDGRVYAVDLARVMPPAPDPAQNASCPRAWPLVQQLRPELTAAEAGRTGQRLNSPKR